MHFGITSLKSELFQNGTMKNNFKYFANICMLRGIMRICVMILASKLKVKEELKGIADEITTQTRGSKTQQRNTTQHNKHNKAFVMIVVKHK